MRNPVVKATPLRYTCTHAYLSSTRYHTRRDLSPSLFIHHPSLSSPAPRNTSDPLNTMAHTTHAASLIYHSPSLSLPLPSSHHIYHLEARVLLNKGILLEDAALELRQL